MKTIAKFVIFSVVACAVAVSDAETFAIERGDTRHFRIHSGPDETEATMAMKQELAAEIKRVTGVEAEIIRYTVALAGDFYISTQPWAAKGAWHYGLRNGIIGIHGSDPAGTEAALRHFLDRHVKNVPTSAGRFEWKDLKEKSGPQWEDVAKATVERVRVKRAAEKAPEWENELVNYVNVEPARAYSFPLALAEDALTPELPRTPYVKSLNGKWRYNWCGAPAQRPQDFWKPGFDDSKWYDITVPSCVELQGFGVPIYTNVKYPHPAKPPYTDRDYNPVSSYRTRFTVPADWEGRNVYLRFEGVYSAYYVWVNGKRVGYSEDSCTAHEFRVTDYLVPGENLLAVEVYRWSDGAYLEDQDYFRYSGIYRNVMLFATPKREIWDFRVQAELVNGYRDGAIELSVQERGEKASSSAVSATLYDADYRKVGAFDRRLEIANVRRWSAEDPYLYTLVVANGSDIRSCKVGFRKMEETPSGAVLFNGRKIKFKGVNRHDASPENGRSVTREEMWRDVMLMKRYNIDTVRTSHYPNDPYFYHLCERYGIYVQAEANVESHGMGYGVHAIASEPSWVSAHVDRCRDMVINWRNSPCVFSWSWGNEAGQGEDFDRATEVCRALDPTLPIVYRQDCERFTWDGPCYPTMKHVRARAQFAKPQFFFEYAHGMGNSIGTLADYWEEFYRHDSLIGGCIWDWVDQAVWKYTDRIGQDGKRIRYLAYGGDHDELNDGNFCCNGIIDAERNVTAKLVEVGHVHRNLVVTRRADGALELWNRFLFTDADAFDGAWELLEDGKVTRSGSFAVPKVAPLSRETLRIDCGAVADDGKERLLNVRFALKREQPWAPKGWIVAQDQVTLSGYRFADAKAAEAMETPRFGEDIELSAGATRVKFSRATGTISELTIGGKTVMKDVAGVVHGPRLTCMRALTDNDRWLRDELYESGLTQLRYHVRELKPVPGGVRATVEVNGAKSAGFLHVAEYRLDSSGRLTIANEVTPFGRMPSALPRLGLSMMLEPAYEQLTYYGRGPWENYLDRCSGSFLGIWKSTVSEQEVDYIRPQDNGYKCEVRWAEFTSGEGVEGCGLRVEGSVPLFMQAIHRTWEDLEFARHRKGQQRIWNVKPPRREVCLNLDIRQLGLGGGSCGPRPEPEYIFPIRNEKWSVTLSGPLRGAAVDYVDPMIGTGGGGNTLPGPVWPFGMVQPGPDTAVSGKTGWYGSSENGYNPNSTKLMGFTQTHLSGTGCCDLQDFLLLPFVGDIQPSTFNLQPFLVTIDKRTEKSSPGYYAVSYAEMPVKAELTCSRRVAYHRYTFAKGGRVHVLVDLQAGPFAWWKLKNPKHPRDRVVKSEGTLTEDGVMEAHNVVTCWNDNRNIFAKIAFSPRPSAVRELPDNGKAGKRWILDFDVPAQGVVQAKAAISGVDIEGARANFVADPEGFDFDARRAECAAAWGKLLSRIEAKGTDEQLTMFYTALYHAYVQPNLLSDVDGRVRFADERDSLNSKVCTAKGFEVYSNFSTWDTFRATHPLYTIVTPGKVDDMVKSMLATYAGVGILPKWQMFGGENYCMVGVHSIPVMADACLKGITTASAAEMLASAVGSVARERDNAEYDRLGYIPYDNGGASVSRTLEWGIDDWAIAKLAEKAGDQAMAELSNHRARYYRNLYDPSTGCMRAKSREGKWRTPFDPYKQKPSEEDVKAGIKNDYTEGGAWQYAGHVLQDVDGLVALHGGPEGFAAFLEKLFTDQTQTKHATGECSGRIGQFALGNEHDQHVPYLWQYANRPDRTAEIVRELCEKYYSAKPDGICGNDDCGQMSAWYVFACLGFYPVNPCGGEYVLGAPQLPRIELKLENGRTFTVIARNLSKQNRYVKSVTLNGRPLKGFLLKHSDIVAGGELVFEMTAYQ